MVRVVTKNNSEAHQCLAILANQQQCQRQVTPPDHICPQHRVYFRQIAEVTLLHCNDCPFTAHAKQQDGSYDMTPGIVDRRCAFAFKSWPSKPLESPCHYELQDMVIDLSNKEDAEGEMQWLIEEERKVLKRAMMFQARGAYVDPDTVKLMDNHMKHLEQYGAFKGWSRKHNSGDSIQVATKEEQEALLKEIMGARPSGGIPDIDDKENWKMAAENIGDPKEKKKIEKKLKEAKVDE